MCVATYIHAVDLKAGPIFAFFALKTGPRVVLKTGRCFFLTVIPHFHSVLRHVQEHI